MAGHVSKHGPSEAKPEDDRSRSRGKQARRAPRPEMVNECQVSAEDGTRSSKATEKARNVRNRKNLASQIRSLEKLLKHPGTKMSADVRQDKGRELAALVLEREKKKAKLRATKNLGRYHMVRFIERQKCERSLKQLRRALEQRTNDRRGAAEEAPAQASNGDSDSDMHVDENAKLPTAQDFDLEDKTRQTEIDLNYTIYAPLSKKYISLFPHTSKEGNASTSEESRSLHKAEGQADVGTLRDDNIVRHATPKRPPMWFRVQQCMQDGTLELLRDGKLDAAPVNISGIRGKKQTSQRLRSMPDSPRADRAIISEKPGSNQEGDDEEQEIDGGFFERA